MRWLDLTSLLTVVLAFALTSCRDVAARTRSQSPAVSVYMRNHADADPYAYTPKTIWIQSGTRIVWRNQTSQPHTVTQSGEHPVLDSGSQTLIEPHRAWSFVFQRPGRYHYFCLIHPFMKGTIVVKAGATKHKR